jgi:hypothetical protein
VFVNGKIGKKLMPQTELRDCRYYGVKGNPDALVIIGIDKLAGGGVESMFQIIKRTDGTFQLERLKPFGGDLGVFHRQQ